jgi:uncharacterized MnhB-related membrane protein
LLGVSSIDALLHDAAPVLVASYLGALLHHSFVYELVVLWLPCEEDLLDDVVAVDVFSQLSHLSFQVLTEHLDLVRRLDDLDYLLDGPRSVGVATQVDWVVLDLLDDGCELFLSAGLSDLLSQVVAEGVVHEVHVVLNCVVEDAVHYLLVVLLYLLLQEPAPALVSG